MRLKFTIWSSVIILLILQGCAGKHESQIDSPDRNIELTIREKGKNLQYDVFYKHVALINNACLGLVAKETDLSLSKILDCKISNFHENWTPLFGKASSIINQYREINFVIETKGGLILNFVFRVFNDGIAFRYEIPSKPGIDSLTIISDVTEFNFSDDFISRPIDLNVESSDFIPKPISRIKFSKLPLLVNASNCWVAVNEASVFDFSMMYLRNDSSSTTMNANIGISLCALPLKTPWRVIQIGEKAGDLIESNILVNLNEPSAIENTDWIKPGKAMWDWRNHGDTINGFVYGINEASYKRLIDFASANDIGYVLFDAAWYSAKGPQFPRAGLDMQAIIRYANEKRVDVLLYVDRQRSDGFNKWDLEEVLQTFQDWGAAGIKYGFLASEIKDRKSLVDATRKITRLCANHYLLVDFHDNPVHPSGEERMWPNRIALEYCHAQQDARKSFSPAKAVTVPFVNGLSGALDMANGFFDLNGLQNREKVDRSGLNSTVVGETARCLINYSPLLILPDNGDVYTLKADLFSFIRQMPNSWDETKVLDGVPGEFIVIARRNGNNWFVAANTNEQGREISVQLNFLESGTYEIIKYQDGKDAHFQKNKETYEIVETAGKSGDTVFARMAPGGGFCMRIRPINSL